MLEQSRAYRKIVEERARLSASELADFLNAYPPFAAAGIQVVDFAEDSSRWKAQLTTEGPNANYMGTHFGGSLYAMCDPFFVLILIRKLGADYVVWDLSASIRFEKATADPVTATFELSDEQIHGIRDEVAEKRKCRRTFTAEVVSQAEEVVARVEKVLYVRRSPLSGVG